MKRIIIAVFIILGIVGLGVWEQQFIHTTFDQLVEKAEEIKTEIEAGDGEKALATASETCEWWAKKQDILELISPHNEIKDVLLQISEIEGNLYSKQLDVALSRIIILQDLCESRKCILSYKLHNVL